MTKADLKCTNPDSIQAIGLDVAKDKVDICFSIPNNTIFYQITNEYQAINGFLKELERLRLAKSVPFVLESTGDYHLLLAKCLKEYGWNVKEINPIIVSNYIKHSIRGTKTDKTDSELLAKIGVIEGASLKTFTRSDKFIKLKKKVGSLKKVEKAIQTLSGNVRKSKETYKKMGWEEDETIMLMEEVVKELKATKKGIEQAIEIYELGVEEENQVERLDSIIGITKLTAKILYAYCGDKSFQDKRALLAYFGLDAKLRQSGQRVGSYKMSKRGEPYIRKLLFQSAFCGKQHYHEYEKIYQKEKEKGKHHFIAVLAVAKKMVYIMWSLLTQKRIFDPNYNL